MKTRAAVIIASVAVIALVFAGVGYAYTTQTTVANNTLTEESINVRAYVNGSESYTGAAEKIDYDTKRIDENTLKYGVLGETSSYQKLTDVNKIALYSNNSTTKTLSSIVVTINGNNTLLNQFGDSVESYKASSLKLTLTNSSASVSVNGEKTANGITFTFDSFTGFDTTITSTGVEYGFSLEIAGDNNNCVHTAVLDVSNFNIDIKAVA